MNEQLSFSEELFWRAEHLERDPPPFAECPRHMSTVLGLTGPLNVRVLAQSFTDVVQRHPVLRSAYREEHGQLRRTVLEVGGHDVGEDGALQVTDVGGGARSDGDAVRGLIRTETQAAFDLTTGPLWRWRLFRLGPDEHVLAMTVHHIVFDGWSRRVLLQELQRAYDYHLNGGPDQRAALTADYSDYVAWQRTRLQSEFAPLVSYWGRRLEAAPRLVFPRDPGAVTTPGPARGSMHEFELNGAAVERLRALSRTCGVTLATVVLGLFALLLRERSGMTDLLVGVPVTDWPRPAFERLIGLFLNMIVLRADLSRAATFSALVAHLHEVFMEAHDHRAMPYSRLLDVLERGTSHALRLGAVFNFGGDRPVSVRIPGVDAAHLQGEPELAPAADLSLHAQDRGAVLSCILFYRTDVFEPSSVERMAARLAHLADQIATAPEGRLESMLDPS